MSELKGKVVAITGASSGIGEATARHLAEQGARVVLGARRDDRLKAFAAELVSNAGLMPLSLLEEVKVDEWDRMIDVTIRDVLHGIAAALPVFRAAGSGLLLMCHPSPACR